MTRQQAVVAGAGRLEQPLLVLAAMWRELDHFGAVGRRCPEDIEGLAAVTGDQTIRTVASRFDPPALIAATVARPLNRSRGFRDRRATDVQTHVAVTRDKLEQALLRRLGTN